MPRGRARSEEIDNVMADYTLWHLTRAAGRAAQAESYMYGGTMGLTTLLKGG